MRKDDENCRLHSMLLNPWNNFGSYDKKAALPLDLTQLHTKGGVILGANERAPNIVDIP